MKKINLFVFCFLLVGNFTYSQDFPGYGSVNGEEINLKQCSFDKEANAVVLLHEAYSDHDDQRRLITTHHIRIKILNEKGFSSANITIPFYRKDDFELISSVEGMTINVDKGNAVVSTPLEHTSVFTRKTNERMGEVVFTFPAIQAGSIIDYKYKSTMDHYGRLEDWYFQDRLPVMVSRYTLIIVPNMEFAYRVNKSDEFPIVIKRVESGSGVYFEMNNIPGLVDEPYMDARSDYLQKVIFQLSGFVTKRFGQKKYMTSWDEVTRELLSSPYFGSQIGKSIPGTEEFVKQVKIMTSPEEKMKAVYNYVRINMRWNRVYSKYAFEGVKEAWQRKSGNSGEINLLLVNLLREVSLDANPMLVSERFHGKVDISYPFIDQFNSVFACVVINNSKYFLDGTEPSLPAHITPYNILNTTAFIVNRKTGGLINIANDTAQYKEIIVAALTLAENGSLSGDISVHSREYARIKKLDEFKADKNKYIATNFMVEGTDFSVKDLKLKNIENDSLTLEQNCALSGNLQTAGDFSFLPLNLFTGFYANPFLSDIRFSNINFGFRRIINLNITIQLPTVFTVDDLPKSLKLSNPDKDIVFIRQIQYDKQNNYLTCMIFLEFTRSLYDKDMYAEVKVMYQKMLEYLKEPLVLKRK